MVRDRFRNRCNSWSCDLKSSRQEIRQDSDPARNIAGEGAEVSFDSAFQKTVGLEGGFGADPHDRGNWTGGRIGVGELKGTKYGISAAAYPDLDIRNLSLNHAKDIYLLDYWIAMRLDEIQSDALADEIFDTGVNMGLSTAVKIAQRALNFMGVGIFQEDGMIGPMTLAGINLWALKDEQALFKALNGFQFMRYVEIVNNSDHTFARGWMKRIQDYRSAA